MSVLRRSVRMIRSISVSHKLIEFLRALLNCGECKRRAQKMPGRLPRHHRSTRTQAVYSALRVISVLAVSLSFAILTAALAASIAVTQPVSENLNVRDNLTVSSSMLIEFKSANLEDLRSHIVFAELFKSITSLHARDVSGRRCKFLIRHASRYAKYIATIQTSIEGNVDISDSKICSKFLTSAVESSFGQADYFNRSRAIHAASYDYRDEDLPSGNSNEIDNLKKAKRSVVRALVELYQPNTPGAISASLRSEDFRAFTFDDYTRWHLQAAPTVVEVNSQENERIFPPSPGAWSNFEVIAREIKEIAIPQLEIGNFILIRDKNKNGEFGRHSLSNNFCSGTHFESVSHLMLTFSKARCLQIETPFGERWLAITRQFPFGSQPLSASDVREISQFLEHQLEGEGFRVFGILDGI